MKTTSPEYSPGDSYCPNLPTAPLPEMESKAMKQVNHTNLKFKTLIGLLNTK